MRTPVKLAAYGLSLAVVFAGTWAAGRAVGPIDATAPTDGDGQHSRHADDPTTQDPTTQQEQPPPTNSLNPTATPPAPVATGVPAPAATVPTGPTVPTATSTAPPGPSGAEPASGHAPVGKRIKSHDNHSQRHHYGQRHQQRRGEGHR